MKLLEGFEKLKIPTEKIPVLAEQMDKYINEIILFNSAYNLVNTSDYDEIAICHILDSLSGAEKIKSLAQEISSNPSEIKIADIGSGGGLPGIPLAAYFPEYNFTLVERMDKRCAFLENVAAILGLKNVCVLKSQAENVPPQSFDIVAFRAFRPLDKKMSKTLLNLLKTGGFLAAYKAKSQNISDEMSQIKDIIREYKVFPLSVPFLTEQNADLRERNLVIVKKS